MKKNPLGRGLESLLPGASTAKKPERNTGVQKLDISLIKANREQPRKYFNDEALNDLVESIKEKGIIQPIVVTPEGEDNFIIIAGERRWRAAGLAGLREIPVIVREVNSESERLELALIENIQRENLNCLETAKAYQELLDRYSYRQEDVAKTIGKSRSSIANTLRILNLPAKAIEALAENLISEGHARALLGLKDEEMILEILARVIKNGLNVRDTEKLVSDVNKGKVIKKPSEPKENADVFLLSLQEELEAHFQAQIKIKNKKKGGTIEILYTSDDELDKIIKTIRGEH